MPTPTPTHGEYLRILEREVRNIANRGLGQSSAFIVGFVALIRAHNGHSRSSALSLLRLSFRVEICLCAYSHNLRPLRAHSLSAKQLVTPFASPKCTRQKGAQSEVVVAQFDPLIARNLVEETGLRSETAIRFRVWRMRDSAFHSPTYSQRYWQGITLSLLNYELVDRNSLKNPNIKYKNLKIETLFHFIGYYIFLLFHCVTTLYL